MRPVATGGGGEGVAGLQPGLVPAHSAILYQKTCRRDTPMAPRPRTLQGTQSCLQDRKQEEQEEKAAGEPGLEAALGHPDRPPTQLKGPVLNPEQSKGRRPLAHGIAR